MDKTKIKSQLKRFRIGFPWLNIMDCASSDRGIKVLSGKEIEEALDYLEHAQVRGKCKFVPASGAASRMFKEIFSGLETENDACKELASNIQKFAFYEEEVFGQPPYNPQHCAKALLDEGGLAYGRKPKGVLRFHRYSDECRTAIAEHLVEGQAYMRNADNSVKIIVTISPEHEALFKEAIDEIIKPYEERYGVKYEIEFTYQDKETDTIAVDMNNEPFLRSDGSMVFRPAGHGALIYNLNKIEEELVSIKNIDNVCIESLQAQGYKWKKVLMGKALELRDRIFGYIFALDQMVEVRKNAADFTYIPAYNTSVDDPYSTPECQELCNEIESFLKEELCIEMPEAKDCRDRAQKLRAKLDRPIRVCGMVKNEGEPGGGPFIIRDKDGSSSLQILEAAQIDKTNPQSMMLLNKSSYFNPVDIVCCLRDHKGDKFDLLAHVDQETGLISNKSLEGRELKALELPGLWNGSMSDWNTLFVEVPEYTFNPVKTVLDLLRPAHQG